jgi:hypothetical protein
MRVFTTALLLTTAIISMTGVGAMPARAHQTKVICHCDCPDQQKAKPRHAEVHPQASVPRRLVRRTGSHHFAAGGYYNYRAAAAIYLRDWHGRWRVAPDDGFIRAPAPVAYYAPPAVAEPQGLKIDDRGWTGGVGDAENSDFYNSYGQNFRINPSVAGPFRNRLMGGFAPTRSFSK